MLLFISHNVPIQAQSNAQTLKQKAAANYYGKPDTNLSSPQILIRQPTLSSKKTAYLRLAKGLLPREGSNFQPPDRYIDNSQTR